MSVGELKELLKMIDDGVLVQSSAGEDFCSIALFFNKSGEICLELE